MSVQARRPAGAPSGGQFATQATPEAATTLGSMEHTGGFGTFAYPDASIAADGALEFVRRMRAFPVSDRMLANADFLYEEYRSNHLQNLLEAEMRQRLAKGGDLERAIEAYKVASKGVWHENFIDRDIMAPAERDARARITAGAGPARIPRSQVADVVRAAQTWNVSNLVNPEQRELVAACPTRIGTLPPVRLEEAADMYWARFWVSDALVDSDVRVARGLERVIEALGQRP